MPNSTQSGDLVSISKAKGWDPSKKEFSLSYVPSSGATDVTEVRLPARSVAAGDAIAVQGGCYDARSVAGEILVKAAAGTKSVVLTVSRK